MPTTARRITAGLVVSLLATLALSGVRAHSQVDPASRALTYLASQQQSDGSIPAGYPSYAPTEEYATAAAAAGYDPNALRAGSGTSVMDYLAAHVGDASTNAGRTGELIEAVVAARMSPAHFGNVNLISTLGGMYNSATGAYGDGQAFSQSFAILGLRTAGVGVPALALTYLHNAQNADGGWDYLAVKGDLSGSDTNSTAVVLMALDAGGDHSLDASALAWLHTQQQSDGGFTYQIPGSSDPDSGALVIEALVATGQDSTGSTWTKSGHSAYANLVGLQAANGGFAGWSGVDAFTTAQVPLALLMQTQPAHGVYGTGFTETAEGHATLSALLYLHSQQSSTDGSVASSFPSFQPTEQFAISAALAGYDPNTLSNGGPTVMQYLAGQAPAASSNAADDGGLIEAVVAAGGDPTNSGGVNLVAKLGTYYNGGGKFGDGQAFTQALALLGLETAGQAVPPAALAYLHAAQRNNGGWNYLATKSTKSGTPGSDTNSTAMVLMALDGAGDHTADKSALAWLRSQQQSDGGFAFQGNPSDPDSTALVTQALMGAHQDPAAKPWSKSGHTSISDLIAVQDSSGGYIGFSGVDPFTTAQVPPALERVAFPVDFRHTTYYVVGHQLPVGTVPPSPTPSPTGSLAPPISTTPTPVATHSPASSLSGAIAALVSTPIPSATPLTSPSPTGAVLGISDVPPVSAHVTGAPRDSSTSPLWYVLAIILGAGVVIGGGTLITRRSSLTP